MTRIRLFLLGVVTASFTVGFVTHMWVWDSQPEEQDIVNECSGWPMPSTCIPTGWKVIDPSGRIYLHGVKK